MVGISYIPINKLRMKFRPKNHSIGTLHIIIHYYIKSIWRVKNELSKTNFSARS